MYSLIELKYRVVGAVVAELLEAVLEAGNTASEFAEHFENLNKTLKSLQASVYEVEQMDEELGDGKLIADAQKVQMKNCMPDLHAQLDCGMVLIKKCSKVRRWNIWKKYKYSKKLVKLEKDLRRFLKVDVQSDIWIETKRLAKDVKDLIRRFSSMSTTSGVQDDSLDCTYAIPDVPSRIVGLQAAVEELKTRLSSQDVVGVCAPGGGGKTTLVAKLCQDEAVKGKFRDIVFLTVSESPNLMVIYQRLWARLVNPNSVPKFINEDDAYTHLAYNLSERKRNPVLVVLDDVWSQEVLEKLLFVGAGIKALVTSRIEFNLLKSVYTLQLLGEKDAMDLFCHLAIDPDQETDKPDDELVKKIVAGCKGLPLALKVIGSSLRGESLRKWRRTEQMLLKGGQIFKEHKALLDVLGTSLISLEQKLKECFMDLGLFPEDEKIPATSVIDMWIEVRGFDEDDAYVALVELSRRNLFTLIERTRDAAGHIEGSFNNLFILQHDLLRELAIYNKQGNHDNNAQQNVRLILKQVHLPRMQQQTSLALIMEKREGNEPENWVRTSKPKLVSINTGDMKSSDWPDLNLPDAEVLILNFSAASYCLPRFLQSMKNLKVLVVANHGSDRAELSGLNLLSSLNKLKRVLLRKVVLPDEPLRVVEGGLTAITVGADPREMQKVSLVLCDVRHMLQTLSLFPIIKELEVDYCTELNQFPDTIYDISDLEKLSITNCPDLQTLPDEISKLHKLKVLRLQACGNLECLPHSLSKLSQLRYLDISDCHSLEAFPEEFGKLSCLEWIDMRSCSNMKQLDPSAVKQMESLKEVVCDDEEVASLWTSRGLDPKKIVVRKMQATLDFLRG
ncbi:unnamed protein product [Victoria cruziana]